MTLAASLDWLGWACLGAIVAGTVYMWVQHRRRKALTRLEPNPPVTRLPNFPSVHATVETPQTTVDEWAGRLRSIYLVAWSAFNEVYVLEEPPRPIPVDKIYLVIGPVDDDHRPIVFFPGAGLVKIQMQPSLPYWWAMELHSIFRFAHFGQTHIYQERNPDDLMRMNMAVEWVHRCYGSQRVRGGATVAGVGS